jgi:hypothetical protein
MAASFGARSVAGTRSNGWVTRERGDGSNDVFGLEGGGESDVAVSVDGGVLDVEEGAVGDLAGGVGALVYGVLEEGLIPAHDEIAVVSIACDNR